VYVDAYVSPEVPEDYVQARINLLSMLREVEAIAGDRVVVRVNTTERFSESAREAEDDFGITPRPVQSTTGDKLAVEDIFLGAAFMSGLDKVVVPFFDLGLPVEYEVVRSIATVSQQKRKRIGVVATDARIYGGFDMQSMSNRPDEPIINELKKQYDTEQVSPTSPISGDFDVLLVVQPSSLPQEQLDHVIDAIRRGVPTAIFEDPMPVRDGRVAGTSQPRLPAQSNPFMNRPPPEPKGDVGRLWDLLQVDFTDREVVWNSYNPYPKLPDLPSELVFIDRGSGAANAFNESSPITSGLQQILMMFGASIRPRTGSTLTFTPLLATGLQSGIVEYDEILQRTMFGGGDLNPNRRHKATGFSYVMAARIQGQVEGDPPAAIDVVVSADIDMLYSVFFMLRERGSPGEQLEFNFDNVTYVLNVLDALAGDDRFMEIRKRRPAHRTLTAVEERTRGLIEEANLDAEKFRGEFDRKQAEQKQKLDDDLKRLQDRPGIDVKQMLLEVQAAAEANERKLQSITANLQRERDRAVEKTEARLAQALRRIQGQYKFTAVLLPPIPPLVLAVGVFAYRRRLEHVGAPPRRTRRGKEDR
jgi:ABC-2 type transport system permease protein